MTTQFEDRFESLRQQDVAAYHLGRGSDAGRQRLRVTGQAADLETLFLESPAQPTPDVSGGARQENSLRHANKLKDLQKLYNLSAFNHSRPNANRALRTGADATKPLVGANASGKQRDACLPSRWPHPALDKT